MNQYTSKGALIVGDYRYRLWREWNPNLPRVLWIMCNPSTADTETDDPTIRKCIAISNLHGFGGIYVGNVFAYRATDPKVIKDLGYPVGSENLTHILTMSKLVHTTIFAWGNHGNIPPHIFNIRALFSKSYCFGRTKSGAPKHPLYLKTNTSLERYDDSLQ